ncbi:MAG: NTP transferase domain-containing protein, partial [Oscillospiraceae bacterium]|nr:NTP transferase domain-containing protein [Oscillospiraceae bacterium]
MGFFFRKKKEPQPLCGAIIVAAGASSRMGLDKLMADIGGLPVIVRCVEAFEQAPSVGEIVVVTREDLVPEVARLCQQFQLTKVSKVISTYTKPDGTPLTAEDFTASKDTGVELKTKAQPDTNYACYVPAGVAAQVDTAWGDVLYANRTGVPHGAGDYLVCALTEDGQPNLEDVWIVNGAIFGSTYDTANGPVVGTITEVEKYGHTVLDVTIEDFLARGFALGDTVNVTFDNGYTLRSIPFFDGYYVEHGEPMVRAYPGHTNIAVCINYGKLFETAGVNVGNTAAITLAQAGGEKDTQTLNSLVYTNSREDYESDEVFANFRAVTVGDIGSLYRSASPVNNENGRASFGNDLMEAAGVAAVLNLGDTDEEIEAFIAGEDFASGY